MSDQEARTAQDSGMAEGAVVIEAPEGAEHVDRADVGVLEVFRWIYRFFYSKTVGLILILLLALYAVIGSVVVQAAPGTFADPVAKQAFLAQVGPNYGAFTGILSALGLFHAFTSAGFYVVVAMLALSVAACTTHRIPELVRRQRQPRLHVSDRFFDKARYRGQVIANCDQQDAMEQVRMVLRKDRFRVLQDPRDPQGSVYADRYAWSGIGTVIAHISFIVILAAFVISATWGVEDLKTVPVGGSVEVGHGTGLTLTAHSFQDSYTEEGRPADYVSELELSRDGQVVAEQEVRVNSPLTFGGFRFHQQTFGIAADFTVAEPGGSILFEGAIPLQWTSSDGANSVGRVDLPEQDLEVIVATPASGQVNSPIPVGAALVEVYSLSTGDPIEAGQVSQGESAEVAGLDVTFERETKYTGILVRQDPGAIWMWVGSILLVVGMCITFMFQYRRIWARVRPAVNEEGTEVPGEVSIRFGAVSRLDASYQRVFENVVAEVGEALSAQPGQIADIDQRDGDEEEDK